MSSLSDAALARLQSLGDAPLLDGTRYEMLGELGRGGMGAVYRVRDAELSREVALKIVSEATLAPDAARRLAREARTLARLEHPGIVPVHDMGVLPDGRAYYVMKLVRGERLDERMRRAVPPAECLRIMSRIGEAVAFAHANGVLHRDLKPQNVMLGAFGEVLVLDWGLAKLRDAGGGPPDGVASVSQRLPADAAARGGPDRAGGIDSGAPRTQDGVALGTPGYMAPEQASGQSGTVDERADVFALGAILRRLSESSGSPASRPLAAIIAMATAEDPSVRYRTVEALSTDLAHMQEGLPVMAYRENVVERAARLARRHQVAIGLVLAYLAMRVALLIFGGR